jgi:hypothetical protein
MSAIRERVEADEVRPEDPLEHLLAPRQDPQDLRRRKRDVEEKPDGGGGQARSDHSRHEHELVVVDPDEVARLPHARDEVGKLLVDCAVHVPLLRVRGNAVEQVVEEGPEHRVGEAVVVLAHLRGREVDRQAPELAQMGIHRLALRVRHSRDVAGPTDPCPPRLLMRTAQAGGQPAAASLHGHVVAFRRHGDRQPVRHENEPRHLSRTLARSVCPRARPLATVQPTCPRSETRGSKAHRAVVPRPGPVSAGVTVDEKRHTSRARACAAGGAGRLTAAGAGPTCPRPERYSRRETRGYRRCRRT